MATSPALLEAKAVVKEYSGGVRALDGVDLTVLAGETLALIGASGCGKTTLLRLFNRMTVPERGRVTLGGRDLAEVDPVDLRRGIGYVQQEGGLLPHWTVAENVCLVPRLLGWPRVRRLDRAKEVPPGTTHQSSSTSPATYGGNGPGSAEVRSSISA